jgi:Xaa-Pro aminopeptidase
MVDSRLNAVLLGTGMNLWYFTGLPSPERNVPRPLFLLIPRRGKVLLFCHSAISDESKRTAQVDEIRTYEQLSHPPISLLSNYIGDIGARSGRIGMELGYEQSLDISANDLGRLHSSLPGVEWVDVADVLWGLRMIKSENEIACLRDSCGVVAEAYAHTFRSARSSMTEREIYDLMANRLHASGRDIFLVITSGTGNYDLVSKSPEQRHIEAGDMVWMDAGCRVAGYWSDYSRAAVAGEPSDLQQRVQFEVAKITSDTIARIRPGEKCSEVARYALERLRALPFKTTSSIAERAGRIGHGIGLTMTEPPHLGLHEDNVFSAGMVVTVEPGVATEYGTFHVEENVVVCEGECEFLTSSPRVLAKLREP